MGTSLEEDIDPVRTVSPLDLDLAIISSTRVPVLDRFLPTSSRRGGLVWLSADEGVRLKWENIVLFQGRHFVSWTWKSTLYRIYRRSLGIQHYKVLSKLHYTGCALECGKHMRTIEVPYVVYMIVDEVDALAAGCTTFGSYAYEALLNVLQWT